VVFCVGSNATVAGMLAEIASAVHSGSVHPRELVDEAIRRIEKLNPSVNAVVAYDADAARAEADGHPKTGPLAGVPVLVKDLVRTKGFRTTFGSPWFADGPVDTVDDALVARLRSAGAIIIGKANTPAFGHQAITTNPVFGATRNPWNLDRSPGGSSGGSSAALAAAITPIATSTDGGGSVRIPASLTGLVGYKPTTGSIGRSFGAPRWMGFSTAGCTGRSVADVLLEAEVVFGPAPGDIMSVPADTTMRTPARPVRVLVCPMFSDTPIDPLMAEAFDEVPSILSGAGYHVFAAPNPFSFDVFMDSWLPIATAEFAESLASFRDQWEGSEPSLAGQLFYGLKISTSDYIRAQRLRYQACGELDAVLGVDTVMITLVSGVQSSPAEGPMTVPAQSASEIGAGKLLIPVNTGQLNVTGHPGVSVPLGHDSYGVPFGMQIVAPRWLDGLALEVAQSWEKLRPWPTVARGYEPWPTTF
jgi:Asp-tRNA(Asn)/Glu-tRNA(Gln) amidotransferase A subunit family amidase